MSDRKDQPEKPYSVDEILAEFGSGKSGPRPKVVEFPEVDPAPRPEGQKGEKPGERPREKPEAGPEETEDAIVEIRPVSPLHGLAARVHTLLRRADHYADHMYDQAEPDEETRRAEQYVPGVDREEAEVRPARPARTFRREKIVPPDTPAEELAREYAKGLKSKRVRGMLALLCAVLCAAVSVDLPGVFDWNAAAAAGELPLPVLRRILLPALLALTGALCGEILGRGLKGLFTLRPRAEAITALAFLFTLGDGIALLVTDWRGALPCCAVTAPALALSLWGDYARRRGDKLSARAAAQSKEPYAVTLDEGKWSGRPVYSKWSGSGAGFGSQLQAEDGAGRAYAVAAPLLILACLVCAGFAGTHHGGWLQFVWSASATLTAASSWSALLVYGPAYRRLARRLFDVGAALAGWPGIARCREGGILMTDQDLFPTGAVRVSGVRVFGDFSNEKVVAYTATLLRVLDCGLTRPFHDLLRSQGAFYREASGVRFHEGGVTGIIRNQEVFVGTAAFMHLMDVDLPQGLNVKHAVFCAIGGRLAGIFALNYAMSPMVNPCLTALMRAGASPILATRDPNLIPALLGQKYRLPMDKMEFPPVDRRLELSGGEQEHDATLVALLSREGLAPYCDAVVGARRLRAAVRLGVGFALTGAALGVALTFYLTFAGAQSALTPLRFLIFMALWLVPTAALTNWVNQY